MTISGKTRVYALLGDPLHKARTPEHFNGLYAARGIDALMVPLELPDGHLPPFFELLKKIRNLDGLIITMPHKVGMAALVDELMPNGRNVGAINAARRGTDGRWTGEMFDGHGYSGALARRGVDARGKRVHMIGSGGVARAIGFALLEKGVASITLTDLDAARASALAAALGGRVSRAIPADADIVINCTPLGMKEGDPLPADPAAIKPGTLVSDVTTKPEITPFLAAAQARGLAVTTGADMFNAQTDALAAFFGWE
jgi:shikimate dehydrogenase